MIDDFKQLIAREASEAGEAGKAVARACAAGDVDAFLKALDRLETTGDGWRHAMLYVSRLERVSNEIKSAFLVVWVETKTLPLKVGHRPTMAKALRVLMPGGKRRKPVRLYRGAGVLERQRQTYGFAWSTRLEVAIKFAEQRREPLGSVVLTTIVTPDAILLDRERDAKGYYDEGEIVVDPFRLGLVSADFRLESTSPRPHRRLR